MSNQLNAPASSSSHSNIRRHRLIVVSCFVFAAGVLALSTVDLKSLISRQAMLRLDGPATTGAVHLDYIQAPQLDPKYALVTSDRVNRDGIRLISESSPYSEIKYGFMTASGKVISPKFYSLSAFKNGRAAVQANSAGTRVWGTIDTEGNYLITPRFLSEPKFHNGVACVQLTDAGHHYINAIVDSNGQILTRLVTAAEPMGQAFLFTDAHGKKGLLDKTGKTILEPVYDRIEMFNDYRWNAYNDSVGWEFENQYRGAYCAEEDYSPGNSESHDDAPKNYLRVWQGVQCGVVDDLGHIVLPVKYTTVDKCASDVALVTENGMKGFADSTGNFVIPAIYGEATEYGKIIGVRLGDKWSLIDSHGKAIKGPSFSGPILDYKYHWFSEGKAPVNVNGKVGFLNDKGELCIKPQFEFATGFKNGVAEVWNGQYWGYIDTNGRYITKQPFNNVMPFHNGKARVTVPGPLWFLVKSHTVEEFNRKVENMRGADSVKVNTTPCFGARNANVVY